MTNSSKKESIWLEPAIFRHFRYIVDCWMMKCGNRCKGGLIFRGVSSIESNTTSKILSNSSYLLFKNQLYLCSLSQSTIKLSIWSDCKGPRLTKVLFEEILKITYYHCKSSIVIWIQSNLFLPTGDSFLGQRCSRRSQLMGLFKSLPQNSWIPTELYNSPKKMPLMPF